MLLLIDNYDSFTYNLVQYFAELGERVVVRRNDEVVLDEIAELLPEHIVISPGPCTPREAGVSNAVIRRFADVVPILGVCLGHQCIADVFGAKVVRARKVMHGKTSQVVHKNRGVFSGLPSPLAVTRYHSLVVDPTSLPSDFEVTAWTTDDEEPVVMGLRHKRLHLEGVQFHPESFMSEEGYRVLENFLQGR